MESTINKDQLIQKIAAAFKAAEYPGDDHLVNKSYGEEPDLVRNHFIGQNDWTKLSPEFLDCDGALAFLSDQAFRFYIPAFMIADIQGKLDLNDPSVRLCWALTPQSENKKLAKEWGGETIGQKAKQTFDLFSKEQVSAIVSYLQWKLHHDKDNLTITQALENYWLERETGIR